MDKFKYIITKALYILFSYEADIVKPRRTKSLRILPTTYKIRKSIWFTILLGAGLLLVGAFGGAVIVLELQPYSVYELWEFILIESVLILAFINQLSLRGEVYVSANKVCFSYRYILGSVEKQESISNYNSVWIQKYRTNKQDGVGKGRGYHIIYLRHNWNRFRTIYLYNGNEIEERGKFYSELFNLQTKKSSLTINKGFI